MSMAKEKRARRTLMILGGAAAASLVLGVLAWMPPGSELMRSEIGRHVLPAFASKTGFVSLITVTTGEATYRIAHTPKGWAMLDKGGYPVTDAKVQELTQALSSITYGQAMTRDERKFDRIGLGDPAHGGTGALLDLTDGASNSFAKLLVGYRDGRTYVRKPDDLQAWAVDGAVLPPLQRGAAWLDLDVLKVTADDVLGADVRPGQGPAYRLQRGAGGGFVLAPPNDRRVVVAALGPGMVAEALTRLTPTDVAPVQDVATGAPLAEHITRLKSGVVIVVRAWQARGKDWVTVSAATGEGANEDAVAQAAKINARSAPWAYALSELDWGAFSTPLNAIAD